MDGQNKGKYPTHFTTTYAVCQSRPAKRWCHSGRRVPCRKSARKYEHWIFGSRLGTGYKPALKPPLLKRDTYQASHHKLWKGRKTFSNWAPRPHYTSTTTTCLLLSRHIWSLLQHFQIQCCTPIQAMLWLHTYCMINSCIYMDTNIPLIIRKSVYSDLIETPQLKETDPVVPDQNEFLN